MEHEGTAHPQIPQDASAGPNSNVMVWARIDAQKHHLRNDNTTIAQECSSAPTDGRSGVRPEGALVSSSCHVARHSRVS